MYWSVYLSEMYKYICNTLICNVGDRDFNFSMGSLKVVKVYIFVHERFRLHDKYAMPRIILWLAFVESLRNR